MVRKNFRLASCANLYLNPPFRISGSATVYHCYPVARAAAVRVQPSPKYCGQRSCTQHLWLSKLCSTLERGLSYLVEIGSSPRLSLSRTSYPFECYCELLSLPWYNVARRCITTALKPYSCFGNLTSQIQGWPALNAFIMQMVGTGSSHPRLWYTGMLGMLNPQPL